MESTVMVTGGVGQVGSVVCAQIAKHSAFNRLIIVDHPKTKLAGEALRDTLRVSSMMNNTATEIEYYPVDLLKVEDLVSVLGNTQPKGLIQVASLMSFYSYVDTLEPLLKKYGFQHHMPAHSIPKDYVLTAKVMEAIQQSDRSIRVVNLCFPDFVNHLLSLRDSPPDVGAGNLDIFVYMMRWLVAQERNCPINEIRVELVGHHALEYFAKTAPFILRIYQNDENIIDQFDPREIFLQAVEMLSEPQWKYGHHLISETTAESAVKNMVALLATETSFEYTPGPQGILGGCGVLMDQKSVRIKIPDGSSLGEVQKINQAHAKLDGVKSISKKGEVQFTDETKRLCRDILHLKWDGFHIDNALECAQELQQAYRNLAQK